MGAGSDRGLADGPHQTAPMGGYRRHHLPSPTCRWSNVHRSRPPGTKPNWRRGSWRRTEPPRSPTSQHMPSPNNPTNPTTPRYPRRPPTTAAPDVASAAPRRGRLIDLTGGFGVDFSTMARNFAQAVYVERQPDLCDIARHNLDLLGLGDAQVVNADAASSGDGRDADMHRHRSRTEGRARRPHIRHRRLHARHSGHAGPADRQGRACAGQAIPDAGLAQGRGRLPRHGAGGFTSLRWRTSARSCCWCYAGSRCGARRGCDGDGPLRQHHRAGHGMVHGCGGCDRSALRRYRPAFGRRLATGTTNIESANDGEALAGSADGACNRCHGWRNGRGRQFDHRCGWRSVSHADDGLPFRYLYEPNAAMMKAGCFAALSSAFGVPQLAPNSHLFVSDTPVEGFPGASVPGGCNHDDGARRTSSADCPG